MQSSLKTFLAEERNKYECSVCIVSFKGGMIKEIWMDEDPREAILKHAEAAANDPFYIAPAYAETQPETIFQESDEEEKET
jgi:hypothetical protein